MSTAGQVNSYDVMDEDLFSCLYPAGLQGGGNYVEKPFMLCVFTMEFVRMLLRLKSSLLSPSQNVLHSANVSAYEIISSGAFVLIPPNIFPSAEQLGLHPRNHTLRCRSFIKHPQIASEHFSLCAGPF